MLFECVHCQGMVATDDSDMGQMVLCGHCEKPVDVPPTKFSKSAIFDDYVIDKMLGRGGMGIVYKARQMSLDRPVALKVLMERYSDESGSLDFIREARAAARLNHPNIVQAFAVGNRDNTYFLAMEFVEGRTLKQIMDVDRTVPLEFALNVAIDIVEALGFAWSEQKLIHRDIKPDNIMITEDGTAKLMDLGLSRFANDTLATNDNDEEVMGTPQYICPEQLIGMQMDIRGDLYSLGATLYHAITGEFPFQARTAAEIAKKHLQEALTPANYHNPSIPPSVCKLIEKMMAKHPDDRYLSDKELLKELNNIKNELTNSKRTPKSKSQPMKMKGPVKIKSSSVGLSKASLEEDDKVTGRNRATTSTRGNRRRAGGKATAESNSRSGRHAAKKDEKQESKSRKQSNPALLMGIIFGVMTFILVIIVIVIKAGK